MSLNRLIKLAQKTGDRLIIHDREHLADIVIMDIDAYEQLLFGSGNSSPVNPISPSSFSASVDPEEETLFAFDEDDDEFAYDETDDLMTPSSQYTPTQVTAETVNTWDEPSDELDTPSPWHQAGAILGTRYGDSPQAEEKQLVPPAEHGVHPIEAGESEALPGGDPVFYEEPIM